MHVHTCLMMLCKTRSLRRALVYMCVCILEELLYTRVCVYIYIYTHANKHMHTHLCDNVLQYDKRQESPYIHVCVYMHKHMYTCIHVYTYTCTRLCDDVL